jgi:chemotaxis protein MotB
MDLRDLLQKEEAETHEEGAPAWYVSFADMAILLMATFLMLLSFASMDLKKFDRLLGSVQSALGAPPKAAPGPAGSAELLPPARPVAPPGAEQALSIIQGIFQSLGPMVEVSASGEGVTLRLEGKVLFHSGSADFKVGAEEVLNRISGLLRRYSFDLYILGHTDSVPIETVRYPSNWELSGARAAAALRYLATRGAAPERLLAVGFADSRPLASNATPEGRSRNRRIEFLFKSPEALPWGAYRAAAP